MGKEEIRVTKDSSKDLSLYTIYFGSGKLDFNSKGTDKSLNPSTSKKSINKEINTKLVKLSKCKSSTLSFNEGVNKGIAHTMSNKYSIAKHSDKSTGIIEGYAANTLKGVGKYFLRNNSRKRSEARVAMVVNLPNPSSYPNKPPNCSFFAIYDGYNGSRCASYLCQNLHHLIIKELANLKPPAESLKDAINKAERLYLNACQERGSFSRSSCSSTMLLIIEDTCYIASVGTGRVIVSM